MLNQVVMVLMLLGSDGNAASGVLLFNSYDECYRSLSRPVNAQNYVYSDRICMSSLLFDNLRNTVAK